MDLVKLRGERRWKALARRFAAYQIYCEEQGKGGPIGCHPAGLVTIRLALSPGSGEDIFQAMFAASCEQLPLQEYERAAVLFTVAKQAGYLGEEDPTPAQFAEYLLANERVFADMA